MHQDALREICQVLEGLNTPVFLLDGEGACLYPRQPEAFRLPETPSPGAIQVQNGYAFLFLPGLSGAVLAVKEGPGAADFLRLTEAMIRAVNQRHGVDAGLDSGLRRLLLGQLNPVEEDSLVRQHRLNPQTPRCVMLLTLERPTADGAKAMLEEMLPIHGEDHLVGIDQHSAALLRDMSEDSSQDLGEYAAALQDTLMNELGQAAIIGIGETAPSLSFLPKSFEQAKNALMLSRIYPMESGIYEHRRLLLERFMMETPEEVAAQYYPLLFSRKTAKLLNEDMLKTISMFLDKNLNLSDASRELYIHRNTLVYRLDKVQKQLGLDLRRFHDAMTFKLLLDLRKRASASPAAGTDKPGKGNP